MSMVVGMRHCVSEVEWILDKVDLNLKISLLPYDSSKSINKEWTMSVNIKRPDFDMSLVLYLLLGISIPMWSWIWKSLYKCLAAIILEIYSHSKRKS